MAEQNKVEIRVTASGAEQASRILQQVAKEGGQLGSVTASGAKQAEQAISGLGRSAQQVAGFMGQAGVSTGVFGQALGALAGPFGIAAAGAAVLGVAIKTTTDFMVANYQQMRELMAVSGLSAEAADQLADTFDLLGLNAEALSGAMFKMSAEIESGGKSFKGLGIDLRDASGQVKTAGALFLEARDKISQMGSASDRNAALLANFGRAGLKLAEVFALSSEEFDTFLQKAGLMGPSAEESMRVTKEYTIATAELSKTWQGFVEIAGQHVLPVLSSITKSMTLAIEEVSSWGQRSSDWFDRMGTGLKALGQDWDDYWRARAGQGPLPREEATAEGLPGGLGTSDIGRTSTQASAGVSALLKGEADALRKLNDMLTLKSLPESQQALETLRRQVNDLAIAAGYAQPAAQALADSIVRLEGAKLATDAMKPLVVALKTLQDATSALKLTDLQQEFLKLKAPVESVIVAMEKAGTISTKVAAEYRALAAAAAQVGVNHKKAEQDLKAFVEQLNSGIDRTLAQVAQGFDHEADAMRKAAEAQKAYAEGTDVLMGAADSTSDAFDQLANKAKGDLVTALGTAEKELAALKATLGQTGPAADVLREFLTKTGLTLDQLDERTRTFLTTLGKTREGLADTKGAEAFAKSVQQINVEAKVFGDRFDKSGAMISLLEQRLKDLAATSQGVVTPQMRALGTELERLRDAADLKDLFKDVFGSALGGLSKFIEGLQLGTRAWKDFGTMALDVLRSIAAEIVNRVLKQALNPLIDKLAKGAAGFFTGAGGGGGAGTGSSGDIDIGGPSMAGGSNFASQAGAAADSLGNLTTAAGFAASGTSNFGTITSNIAAGWDAGFGGIAGAAEGAWTGLETVASAASGLTVGLAGVGAAVAAFSSVMDIASGKTEAGIGGLVGGAIGAAAGAVIGSFLGAPWLGGFIGYAIGDLLGSWIGGMFGGPGNYEMKRIAAADEAQRGLGTVTGGYQSALNTGDIAAILRALQTGAGGPSGNAVRTELVLPSNLAAAIGVQGQQIGDQVVAQWSSITLEQFQKILDAMKDEPGLISNIRGSGDVPYLEGADAQGIADQIAGGAQALLTAFIAMEKIRDKIKTLAVDLGEAGRDILPPETANAFADSVNGFRDRMLAVLSSGIPAAEMQKQLDALAAELQNYVGLVSLYAQVEQDIAQLSRNIAGQTAGAVLGIQMLVKAAGKGVESARGRLAEAITPGETLAAAGALREAILGRYAMEMKLIAEIQGKIQQLLQAQATVQGNLTTAAVIDLSYGDTTAFDALYASLVQMAREAPTAAERLFAVGAGLAAVLAALPTSAEFFRNGASPFTPSGAAGSDEIWRTLVMQAQPFMDELADMIGMALTGGDLQAALGLLQQEAQLIQQIAGAGIQAIEAWAAAAKDAARDAASTMRTDATKNWDALANASRDSADALREDINKNYDIQDKAINDIADTNVKRIEDAHEASRAGHERDIKDIETATRARQKAISLEIESLQTQQSALQEQIQAAEEWGRVVKEIGDFITDLKLGQQAPLNPADQLAIAQSAFTAAQAAFRQDPSAAGAADVQKAAADLLTAGQNVFTRPSPEFQTLFADVIAVLEGVKGAAEGMGPASSADLEAQTDAITARIKALQDESERIGDAADAQVEGIRALMAAEKKAADDAIKVWQDWRKDQLDISREGRAADLKKVDEWIKAQLEYIDAGRAHDMLIIDQWLEAQLKSIELVVATTVQGIKQGMAEALRENAKTQTDILKTMLGSQQDQLNAITDGMDVTTYMAKRANDTVLELEALNRQIEEFLKLIPPNAAGDWRSSGGLRILHPGEMVIPHTPAELLRRGGGFMPAGAGGRGGAISVTINVNGGTDPVMIRAAVRDCVPALKRELVKALDGGPEGRRIRE